MPKKHEWELLSEAEGSWVRDVRPPRIEGGIHPVEETLLAKISRYAFGRRVHYHGFETSPDEVSPGVRRQEGPSCLDDTVNNIVFIAQEQMDWYLQKK